MGRLNVISYFLYFYHHRDFLAKNAHTLALSVQLNIPEMRHDGGISGGMVSPPEVTEVGSKKKSKIPLTKTSFRFRINS